MPGLTNSNYAGNASHHAVRGPRYSAVTGTAWGATAWTSNTLKSGQNINTTRETSQLHCSDCHSSDTNGHGSNTIFLLADKTAVSGWVLGIAADASPVDKLCWGCHSGNVYPTSSTVSRYTHSTQGQPLNTSSASYVTGNCRNCHGGGQGEDIDGTVSTQYGAIHGANTVTARQAASTVHRYRFLGGAAITPIPTSDAGFNATTAGNCYGPSTSANQWSNCQKHTAGTVALPTYNYARPTTY